VNLNRFAASGANHGHLAMHITIESESANVGFIEWDARFAVLKLEDTKHELADHSQFTYCELTLELLLVDQLDWVCTKSLYSVHRRSLRSSRIHQSEL